MLTEQFQTSTSISNVAKQPSRTAITPLSKLQRRLLVLGSFSSVLFVATYSIIGLTRPYYNPVKYAISLLGVGPDGWMQNLNFVVYGVLMIAAAYGTAGAFAGGIGAKSLPFLKICLAISLVVCAFFPQDAVKGFPVGAVPAFTTHGLVHIIASFGAFISSLLMCVIMACRFAKEPQWRSWTLYTIGSAILMMISLAAFGISQGNGGPAGIFERLSTMPLTILGIVMVVRLLKGTGRIASQS